MPERRQRITLYPRTLPLPIPATRVRLGPDEDVDGMIPALVDERGHAALADVIEPAPDERIPVGGKVLHLR